MKLDVPDEEFVDKLEDILRKVIVVWDDEEYRDIAKRIAGLLEKENVCI